MADNLNLPEIPPDPRVTILEIVDLMAADDESLRVRGTRLLGQLGVRAETDREYSDDLGQLLRSIIYDPLTQLPNRSTFEGVVKRELVDPQAEASAVIIIDVARFKEGVNDLHGHSVGDIFLQNLARGIDNHTRRVGPTRPGDVVGSLLENAAPAGQMSAAARTGGDESAALLRDGPSLNADTLPHIVETKAVKILQDPILLDFAEQYDLVGVGLRIGAVMLNPATQSDFHDVQQQADPILTTTEIARQFVYIRDDAGRLIPTQTEISGR